MKKKPDHKIFKSPDIHKSLADLEGIDWGIPTDDSHLVVTCHELRHKPLNQFTAEDFRIMIGQNISLHYLVPLAIDLVEKNPLVSGDFYEGDLLANLLSADPAFYTKYPQLKTRLRDIVNVNCDYILSNIFDKKEFTRVMSDFRGG